jgi:hypothetical protein
MDEAFDLLGQISDGFLEEEGELAQALADQLLDDVTEDEMSDGDMMWWLLILNSLLGPLLDRIPFQERASVFQRLYGVQPSIGFEEAVRERMRGVIDLEAARLRSRVQDAAVGGALGEDFLIAFRSAVVRAIENVIRETDTAMAMYDRLAFAEAGARQPSDRRWAYDGPRDNKNRPFCAAVLDDRKTYSREEIEQLNQHPLLHRYVPPNVRTLCGGYGCRHVFWPVSEQEAKQRNLSWV